MRVLMCSPKYFSIDYEINPWMHKDIQVDKSLAQVQWENLREVYSSLGVEVEIIEPIPQLPDMVFTANAGLVRDKKVVLSNFKFSQRQRESAYFKKWFEENDFEISELTKEEFYEGQGESLWFADTLVAGWGFRATLESYLRIEQTVGSKLLTVKLIDPKYYHLDTCFLPLNQTTAAYFPDAFDFSSKKDLAELVPNLIEVSKEDAEAFACNSVVVGKTVLMPNGAAELPKEIENLGFKVLELPVSEFKKSGGGVRCLTLNLD